MNDDLTRGPRLGELRALGEYASLPAAMPMLLSVPPRGDGHPVVCLPGFGGSDRSTAPLRRYLTRLGYRATPWQQGRNLGGSGELRQRLERLIAELAERFGARVSLVGWSLGGLFALRLGAGSPHLVRQVITLGSPLGGEGLRASELPFPVTAIYSRSDAVVPWRLSRVAPGPLRENLEVRGSHLGLGVNPSVLLAVADRLAQRAEDWAPFERDGLRPFFFPDPDRS